MNDMKFSVAMSVYKNDSPEFLERALLSITEQQTIKPNEIVLVVDGPIDKKIDNVIIDFKDKYYADMNIIYLESNKGLGNALKIAVENSKYEIIARMDSDDISLPTRFEQELECFKNIPNLDIVGGNISEFIDSEENIVAYRNVPKTDLEIKEYNKKRCPFNHMSVMFRKSAVLKAGGYLDLFWNEDYYLWIRMIETKAVMKNTGTVLVNVRTGKDMYKRRGGKRYFKSEKYLQDYMLRKKMITRAIYLENICKRWIIQRVLPNNLRGWVFRRLARNK